MLGRRQNRKDAKQTARKKRPRNRRSKIPRNGNARIKQHTRPILHTMNNLEVMMQAVQIYIYQKKGVKVRIYLRDIRDINMLKEAYDYIQKNQHNKNTNN